MDLGHDAVDWRSAAAQNVRVVVWLDWATIRFRYLRPSSFDTALQLVLRPHFLVHFV
jgi:hypothetical protein